MWKMYSGMSVYKEICGGELTILVDLLGRIEPSNTVKGDNFNEKNNNYEIVDGSQFYIVVQHDQFQSIQIG